MRGAKNHEQEPQEDEKTFWISYADMMSTLIFIFLITLGVIIMQFRKEQDSFVEVKSELQAPTKTREKILVDLQDMLSKAGLHVEVFKEEGLLRLSDQALSFQPAKAVPEADKLGNLGILAHALTTVVPCFAGTRTLHANEGAAEVPPWCRTQAKAANYNCPGSAKGSIETLMIEGHTDATAMRAGAGYLDNLALSAARATTVLRLLKSCNPQLGDLFNKKSEPLIGVSGYSDLRPIIKSDPKDQRNRRIDLRFVMDLPDRALDEESTKGKTKG